MIFHDLQCDNFVSLFILQYRNEFITSKLKKKIENKVKFLAPDRLPRVGAMELRNGIEKKSEKVCNHERS